MSHPFLQEWPHRCVCIFVGAPRVACPVCSGVDLFVCICRVFSLSPTSSWSSASVSWMSIPVRVQSVALFKLFVDDCFTCVSCVSFVVASRAEGCGEDWPQTSRIGSLRPLYQVCQCFRRWIIFQDGLRNDIDF